MRQHYRNPSTTIIAENAAAALCYFPAEGKLQSTLECLKIKHLSNEKLIALPPVMRQENFSRKKTFKQKSYTKIISISPIFSLKLTNMQISIITATYNSENHLQEALNSYKSQDLKDKELIIIDGQSNDTTLEILKQNNQIINQSISEADKGIYDALNKGVELASGDIIGILHSDDFFAYPTLLSDVLHLFKQNPNLEAVYGDLQYVDRDDPNKVIRNWISGVYDRNNFVKGWMPPHPTLFIKKECFQKFGTYNLSYKSAADYDLILRFLYKNKINTSYLPKTLVKMRVGGLSNKSIKNRIRANKEDRLALRINGVPNALWVSILKPLSKITQFLK